MLSTGYDLLPLLANNLKVKLQQTRCNTLAWGGSIVCNLGGGVVMMTCPNYIVWRPVAGQSIDYDKKRGELKDGTEINNNLICHQLISVQSFSVEKVGNTKFRIIIKA